MGNFKKSCDITYSPSAQNVTVELCMRPLVKDCNLSGPEVCRTEYISECWTKNDPHLVEDDVARCQNGQERCAPLARRRKESSTPSQSVRRFHKHSVDHL